MKETFYFEKNIYFLYLEPQQDWSGRELEICCVDIRVIDSVMGCLKYMVLLGKLLHD